MSNPKQGEVLVVEAGCAPYTQCIAAGRHRFVADEPASNGGHDVGPSPYELLMAALGSCTAITLRMFVERNEWPMRRVRVELRCDKIPAPDGASLLDQFHRTIYLEGNLTESQRQRLLEIAEKCPVSQTLRHSSVIDTKLANSDLAVRA